MFLQEKLKRLIKYLNFKDVKNKTQKQTSQDDDEVLEAAGETASQYKTLKTIKKGYLFSAFFLNLGRKNCW